MNKNGEILEQLVSQDFGVKSRDGSRWSKGDEHDSLVIDKERGIFYWNSEGIVGDPIVYLTKVRGLDFHEASSILKEFNYEGTHVYTQRYSGEEIVVYPKLVNILPLPAFPFTVLIHCLLLLHMACPQI